MPTGPAQVLTVTELTRRIKGALEDKFPSIWVEGEISNLRIPQSGHAYFTLKDANAQLAAVLFRGAAAGVKFKLQDGLAVIAFGDIGVYEKQGQYQIVVRQLLPKGLGALQLAFEELKRRLEKEGLFAAERKKPLPLLPQRIGLVTSPTGAAIRDFLNIIGRRFPNVHIVINPVRVQGEGAAQEIADAIDEFNALHAAGTLPLDVLVITRGGGSLEDLWAFNEEVVARALARSAIPTISAVGHEIDFTIADFVADLRAPTPSAAAELVVKGKEEFVRQLRDYQTRLVKDLRLRVADMQRQFTELSSSYVFRQPAQLIRQYQQEVDDLRHRLGQSAGAAFAGQRSRLETVNAKFGLLSPQSRVAGWNARLDAGQRRLGAGFNQRWQQTTHRLAQATAKLDLLSPKSTLQRGYSITRTAGGKIVKTVKAVKDGDRITTIVVDGEFEAEVKPPKS